MGCNRDGVSPCTSRAARRPRRTGRSRRDDGGGEVVELGAAVDVAPALAERGDGDRLDLVAGAAGAAASRARRTTRASRGACRSRRRPRRAPSPLEATVFTIGGRQAPSGRSAEREHGAQVAADLVGAVAVGLVDDVDVADLEDARPWRPGCRRPCPGASSTSVVSASAGDLDLALADADGLDQDHVAPGGVEHPQRLRRGPGEPAEVAARGHRPDVDARGRSRGPASGPGRRAARRRRTATTGRRRGRRPACRARRSSVDQRVGRGRLADAGRAGDADDLGVARCAGPAPPSPRAAAATRPRPARSAARPPGRRRRGRGRPGRGPTRRCDAGPRSTVEAKLSCSGRARSGRRPGRRRRTARPRRRRRRGA